MATAIEGDGNELAFELTFDQTDVPRMLRELDRILEALPVMGEAPGEG